MPAPRLGSSPARAVTLTMRPDVPDASIDRIAARLHRKVVRALVSIISAKDADSIFSTGAMVKPPARWIDPHKAGTWA